MNENEYGGFIERTPLSERLSVESGTKKARTAIERPRRQGITGGLSALDINYQKVVKRKRKGQPDNLTEGVEADSQADIAWEDSVENPGEPGMDGETKHFMQLLYQDHLDNGEEAQSNFF